MSDARYPVPEDALGATDLIDADAPIVRETAVRVAGDAQGGEAVRLLFDHVRDEVAYEMAPRFDEGRDEWKASATLERGYGFCQTLRNSASRRSPHALLPLNSALADDHAR